MRRRVRSRWGSWPPPAPRERPVQGPAAAATTLLGTETLGGGMAGGYISLVRRPFTAIHLDPVLDPLDPLLDLPHLLLDLLDLPLNLAAHRLEARLELAAVSLAYLAIACGEEVELLLRQALDVDELIARPLRREYQFVELQVQGLGLAILGVLDEEDHQEGDDGRPRVDDQLPGLGVAEVGPGRRP